MQIANEKDFSDKLIELGALYEEGKDMLNSIPCPKNRAEEYHRLFEILRKMRDLAATQMQSIHFVGES